MLNVTKLSVWPELQKLGFVRINYHAHAKIVAVGASLRHEHRDLKGNPFYSDYITIEPHNFQYSDRRYHITGSIKTPFFQKCFRVNGIGRKEEIFELQERINEFYSARQILATVQLMLK